MRKLKLFLSMLMLIAFSVGNVWAATATSTLTFSAKCNGSGTADDDVAWTVTSDGTESTYDATKGIHYGTSSAQVQYIRLSTSGISGTISQVVVNASVGSGVSATVAVKVGSTDFTCGGNTTTSLSTSATNYTFTGSASGDILVEITKPSKAAKALYCKSVAVTYDAGGTPDPTLESIVITGAPDKIVYEAGEEFDPTGLVATGYYDNSTDADLTSSVDWAYTPAGALTQGLTSVNVTATKGTVVGNKDVNITVNAASPKSSLIFAAACGGSGTADDGAVWAVTSDGAESVYDGTSGIHYGTGSANVTYVQLATSDISGEITKVVVNARDAQAKATISVTVGGTAFTCASATATNTSADYVFTGTGSGEIVVRVDRGSSMSKAIYVKSVVVTYVSDGKEAAGLAFDAAQKLAKVGGTLAAPILSTADGFDGTVTYASSDETVVKVNASTGTITEIVAAGKAVITAHSDATENFKEGSASYTIFVAEQAGTNENPLTEASAKALIDLGCEMEVYVHGTVLGSQDATKFTVTLAGGMQFYKLKDLGNVAFESAYIKNGDEVTAIGTLTKYYTTYELAEGCYLTAYTEYTEPLVDISNTKETAYTVAQALGLATNPTSDLTKAVYIAGVVYDVKSFNSTNGTLDIYIKDAGEDNKFEFYKCAGIYDESLTAFTAADDVQVGDEVIGYGVMKYFSGGSIWEFDNTATGDYLVELTRPAVAVTGIDLTESTAEVEVGSTVTLHASVVPGNATDQGIEWSVTSGSDKASVDENGVVTGTAAGEAVIRAASHEDASIYEECTVTVTAVDPTKHTVTFIAGTDQSDETSITKDGITISASTFNNASYYQCYSGAAMTVSSTVGNITKIELTCTTEGTAKYGPGNWDFTGYSYSGANGSWTGSAETVEFGNASQQVRMTLITVTYKEDNRAAAGLAWDPAEDITLTVGDAFTAPTLLNPNSIDAAEITIESSNPAVATVTAGVVALVADATGTTTITATFAGNDDYKPATISYNITVNEAGLDNVTFDSSEDHAESGETTITKGGFTLSFTSGSMDGTQAEYRLYKSQTMTLSSTDYLIKKIEFTCTSGNPITGFADATGLDKDNNEWTGESNTVELTASNAQVRMTKIKVFYVEDTRAAAGLAWNPAGDIELTVGDALTAPALLNPNSIDAAEITIESSNTDLATVSEGVVSLVADATGTTTITATFAGNDDFKPATVSYKITVNPAHSIYVSPSLNVNFGNVDKDAEVADKTITVTLTGVDAATLTLAGDGASAFTISPAAALTASGDITISASSADLGTFAATLTISDDASQAESKVVHLSLTVNEVVVPETPVSTTSKWVAATEIVDGMQVLIVGVNGDDVYAMGAQTNNNRTAVQGSVDGEGVFTPGDNTMAFTLVAQGDGTYAIMSSNDKYLYAAASGNNYLRTQAGVDDNAKWTLSLTSAVAESSSNRNVMQFNSGSSIFSCYASASQKSIALYVPKAPEPPTPDYTRDVTNGHYGTICLPKAGTIEGATLYEIGSFENNLIYIDEVGTTLAAGVPYIFYASEAQLSVYYTDKTADDVPAGNANGLFGFYNLNNEAATFDIPEGAGNYILYNDQYWLVDGRAAYIANYRAYIKLGSIVPKSAAPGRRRVAMAVNGENAAQGFENIESGDKPMKVMIEGTMYILRGEKVYDATGRLVK